SRSARIGEVRRSRVGRDRGSAQEREIAGNAAPLATAARRIAARSPTQRVARNPRHSGARAIGFSLCSETAAPLGRGSARREVDRSRRGGAGAKEPRGKAVTRPPPPPPPSSRAAPAPAVDTPLPLADNSAITVGCVHHATRARVG